MFTKKIALLGLAGLTALSMSCSDDGSNSEDVGGAFNPALTVVDDAELGVLLGGKIVATEGNTVKAVTITANGTAIDFVPALTGIGTKEVNLAGHTTESVCDALNNTTTIASLKIVIKAEFEVGTALVSPEKTLSNYSCTSGSGTPLDKSKMDLSESAASFADADEGKTFTRATITKTTVKDIDLIARFSGTVTPDRKIYTPATVGNISMAANTNPAFDATTDLFWAMIEEFCDVDEDYNVDPDCTYKPYGIGGWVIPNEGMTVLNSATTWQDIAPFIGMMTALTEGEFVQEFSGTANTGFLLKTSKGEFVAILVSSSGNTATAITLNGISMQ